MRPSNELIDSIEEAAESVGLIAMVYGRGSQYHVRIYDSESTEITRLHPKETLVYLMLYRLEMTGRA